MRNAPRLAISSSVPKRCRGLCSSNPVSSSGVGSSRENAPSVRIAPGAIATQRTPRPPHSTARLRMSATTPAFATGSAYVVPSAVAKAGVVALMRSLAVEWGGRGVRCVAIAPGAIRTEGAFSRLLPTPELETGLLEHNPLHRFGTLEEIANLGAFLISDQAGYINGEMVYMDGGEMLAGASTFSLIGRRMPDAAWEMMKPRKK